MKTVLGFTFTFFAIFLVSSGLTAAEASESAAEDNAAVRYEYSCIDVSGVISQCPGNVRPTAVGIKFGAWVKYANRINATGWAEMELVSNGQLADHQQAYSAGRLEGFVTAKLIRSHRFNLLEERGPGGGKDWCANLSGFISANLNYTLARARSNKYTPYWQQVALVLYQLAGMDDGYAAAQQNTGTSNTKTIRNTPHMDGIDPCGMILLNLYTEFGDIQSALNQTLLEPRSSHCSAIVKVLPNLSDVLVAHNT